jgi:hypothetical protein
VVPGVDPRPATTLALFEPIRRAYPRAPHGLLASRMPLVPHALAGTLVPHLGAAEPEFRDEMLPNTAVPTRQWQ